METSPDTIAVLLEYPIYDQIDQSLPTHVYLRRADLPLVEDAPDAPRLALVDVADTIPVRTLTVPTGRLETAPALADDGFEHDHAVTRSGRLVRRTPDATPRTTRPRGSIFTA